MKKRKPTVKGIGKCRDCRWEHGRHEKNTNGEYFLTLCPWVEGRSVFLNHECEVERFAPKTINTE